MFIELAFIRTSGGIGGCFLTNHDIQKDTSRRGYQDVFWWTPVKGSPFENHPVIKKLIENSQAECAPVPIKLALL